MTPDTVIDVDFAREAKHGQYVPGDVFLSRRVAAEGRVIAVLSDGLGSGVKASVLANLTATMALKYTEAFVDPRASARTIMDTLPVCEVRRISYSTFTIVDTGLDGQTEVIEHGNPALLLLRDGAEVEVDKREFTLERWRDRVITHASFEARHGDRLMLFSDGVTQSGMGAARLPLGWTRAQVVEHATRVVGAEPGISSLKLARSLVDAAVGNDGGRAKDDVTCGVISFRTPRRLLVATGPPFAKERDAELANLVRGFPGRCAICGGTTATIVARVLGRDVTMDLSHIDPEIPPASAMDGVSLVTEGTITLARAGELLEQGAAPNLVRPNAADRLVSLMLDSDVIDFVVGTRINEAHQDPAVPVGLDLRRNIIRRITGLLETKYLKQTTIRFL